MNLFKKWSDWEDLSSGHFDHKPYLLQGRRRSDGKVEFRVATTFKTCWYASVFNFDDLKKLIKPIAP